MKSYVNMTSYLNMDTIGVQNTHTNTHTRTHTHSGEKTVECRFGVEDYQYK